MTLVALDPIGALRRLQPVDPVDDLLVFHRRIRGFVALARRLPEVCGISAENVAEAAASIAGWFSDALPLHTADEDRSVRPLLERATASAVLRAQLERMSAEHGELQALLDDAVPLWREVAVRPSLLRRRAAELERVARELETHLAAHLEPEEAIVFPALRALDPVSRVELLLEMRARRDA